ncbi:MAG: hypothetical protein H0X26_09300 [Alphaproteobacteria bacterium]|nr:hypothetical protein [Alphaproteobacteria bacterium]
MPEHYDVSGDLQFHDWIKDRLERKSKIYFPAIQYKPISSLDEVLPKPERTYAKQKISSKKFEEALDFGENIQASFLSINPTHFIGNGNQVLRMSDPEDDNPDSLVLRIENGKSSATLTGDATGLTTTRILNNYYAKEKSYLNTNALVASHHGSFTHGSNNKEWIAATQPEFVIISNGLLHGHPHEDAYNIFKQSSRLKRVTNHKILVAQSKTSGFMHQTQNPIFSTLTSGTITVSLEEDGEVKIKTENNPNIEILGSTKKKKKKDIMEEVIIQEEEEQILVSPTPQKSLKNFQTGKIPFSLDILEKEEISKENTESDEENKNIKKIMKLKKNSQLLPIPIKTLTQNKGTFSPSSLEKKPHLKKSRLEAKQISIEPKKSSKKRKISEDTKEKKRPENKKRKMKS